MFLNIILYYRIARCISLYVMIYDKMQMFLKKIPKIQRAKTMIYILSFMLIPSTISHGLGRSS